LLIEYWVFPK